MGASMKSAVRSVLTVRGSDAPFPRFAGTSPKGGR
jgi:hypothetical protein